MKKYQYTLIEAVDSSRLVKELNQLGEGGWRALRMKTTKAGGWLAVLERPTPDALVPLPFEDRLALANSKKGEPSERVRPPLVHEFTFEEVHVSTMNHNIVQRVTFSLRRDKNHELRVTLPWGAGHMLADQLHHMVDGKS